MSLDETFDSDVTFPTREIPEPDVPKPDEPLEPPVRRQRRAGKAPTPVSPGEVKDLRLRIPAQIYMHLTYWSQAHGVSMNTYIIEAVQGAIARENGDYDLPTLEIQRNNEMSARITSLEKEVSKGLGAVQSGLTTLTNMAVHSDYLTRDRYNEGGITS